MEKVPLSPRAPSYGGAVTAGGAVDLPTFRGQVPDTDIDELTAASAAPAVALPPLSLFDELRALGTYPGLSLGPTPVRPPPSDKAPPKRIHRGPIPRPEPVTPDQARGALLDAVAGHRCWGKGPAADAQFTQILPSHAFHYTLQSYTESRSVALAYQPHDVRQPVDSLTQSAPPPPWNVLVPAPAFFASQAQRMPVPHTDVVKRCYHCNGHAAVRCFRCCGRGRLRCGVCRGKGKAPSGPQGSTLLLPCTNCFGTGRRRCGACSGRGEGTCAVCTGLGHLKIFVQLIVTWTTHVNDHVVEKANLPPTVVVTGNGVILFEEEVAPLRDSDFAEDSICTASHGLLSRHASQWPQEQILRQRHHVRAVPVSEVQYYWKGQATRFWIIGLNRQVFMHDYPASVCMGCTVS